MALFPLTSNFEGDFVLQLVAVDTDVVALVQEMHAVVGHLLCEIVEERLGLA